MLIYLKTATIAGFLALMPLLCSSAFAQGETAHRILQCQTSLKKVCIRLEQFAKNRENQYYYSSLYQQTQDFLKKLNVLPRAAPETSSILDQCDNFLITIYDILGHHHAETPLAPMSNSLNTQRGRLSAGANDVKSRSLRTNKPIRYILASEDNFGVKEIEDEEKMPETEPLPHKKANMKDKSSLEEME